MDGIYTKINITLSCWVYTTLATKNIIKNIASIAGLKFDPENVIFFTEFFVVLFESKCSNSGVN